MRILLAGPLDAGDATNKEVDKYRAAGNDVVVNTSSFKPEQAEKLKAHYQSDSGVDFRSFDPEKAADLKEEITKGNEGYDAIVYPADLHGFTADVVTAAKATTHPLKAVGCPNDVVEHLKEVEKQGVAVIKSSEIHKDPVARYTLTQMEYYARRIDHFSNITGVDGAFPHDEAFSTTHSLKGKTLGVMGASGKDGGAVARFALELGMNVIALKSEKPEGNAQMARDGIKVVSLDELVAQSDFISVNTNRRTTAGWIGKEQFAKMKPGVVIVNPAGAEIINKEDLVAELSPDNKDRKVGKLILDMPYGNRAGFASDPVNKELKEKYGVIFTPRMAGYNIQSYTEGVEEVAGIINKTLQPPGVNGPLNANELDELRNTIITLAKKAGENAKQLRDSGQLVIETKPDGTPATNADKAAEEMIRDGLRQKGYNFNITGEELGKIKVSGSNIEVVIDGIDGTSNFRDSSYGWCTSVMVMQDNKPIIGVVHDPERGETFSAAKGKGAFLDNGKATKTLQITNPSERPKDFTFSVGSFKINGSHTTQDKIVKGIEDLRGRRREMGSIALSLCGVARGSLGSFIQGDAKLHDCGAALLIAKEAGAGISTTPREEGKQHIVAAHPELLKEIDAIFTSRTTNVREWTGVSAR